jgi:hypothetical protein
MADALAKPNGSRALAKVDGDSPSAQARLEVAQARARLSQSARALKGDLRWLELPLKVTASVKKNPLLWLGGALLIGAMVGAVTMRFPRRDDGDE